MADPLAGKAVPWLSACVFACAISWSNWTLVMFLSPTVATASLGTPPQPAATSEPATMPSSRMMETVRVAMRFIRVLLFGRVGGGRGGERQSDRGQQYSLIA